MKRAKSLLLIFLLTSLIIFNFSTPVSGECKIVKERVFKMQGQTGTIELEVENCGECEEGEEEECSPTAYFYAEVENTSNNATINGSIKYVITDETGTIVYTLCVPTGLLRPGDSYTDSLRSFTFSTIGNKTFTAYFYNSPNCVGFAWLDMDSTVCYFIPTLGKVLLSVLVITLVGISVYRWKKG